MLCVELQQQAEDDPRTETYHTEIINNVVDVVLVSYLLINVRNTLV
jgi:hypothetical protein